MADVGWPIKAAASGDLRARWHGGDRVDLRLAVVAISSVGGGPPNAGWSDLEIRHLVQAASRGDIVAGEKQVDGGRWWCSTPLP